jgi:hypothetical protein
MAGHSTISTESDLASPTMPTTAVTRRSLLGGAGAKYFRSKDGSACY